MNIGLIDVDSRSLPNFALMRLSAYYKKLGYNVEWANTGLFKTHYDQLYKSKIFTFTPDIDDNNHSQDELFKGGTGYDVSSRLPLEIESSLLMDYSLYPQYSFSVQFFSRGCLRNCEFCLVRQKEGYIKSVEPVELNPKGQHIEVLDNNFFANPEWKYAVDYILKSKQKVNLHGIDVRLMNDEQAYYLNLMKFTQQIKIAWDNPQQNLLPAIKEMLKRIKAYKIKCYVLVGFKSTIEEDLNRIYTLRDLGITPFVMPYRDYENNIEPSRYAKDLARYCNKPWILKSCNFEEYEPRKGFKCSEYFKND